MNISKCFHAKIKEKLDFLVKLSPLFTKKEKTSFMGIMAIALVEALFQILGIASILPFMSLIMKPDIILSNSKLLWIYNFFGFESTRAFIIAVGLGTLLIIILGNILSALATWLETRFAWRKNHSLATALLDKYLSLPYSYFLNHNTADLGKNILDEVQNLTKSFILPMLEILVDLMVVFFIFVGLIVISPMATVTILSIFFILYGAIYRTGFRNQLKSRGKSRMDENKGRFKVASEALGGIKDIKVLGRENYFINEFVKHSLKFSDLQSWNVVVGQLPRYFIEIVVFGGAIVFILLLMVLGRDIKQMIPMASFFAFAGYRLLPIMNKMFEAFTKVQFNSAVLDRIHRDLIQEEWLKLDSPDKYAVNKKVLKFEKNVEVRDLSYSYPGTSDSVFRDINLTINKGTSVAIVGPTGTGKTTFVDIILGLLTPTGGTMEVDGVEIGGENLKSWQRNLGYVPQHIYLSDDTIRRNIAFGLSDEIIDMKRIERVAKISNIHDFIINELPEGYDTIIGERGIRLSGGQRQRVGIARALYNDPDILVLDEATSSLDGITEGSVLKAIENISKLKTLIVIAHRLATVKNCDMIYLLDKGRIAAQGSYDELLANNAQFRAMARES